MSRKLLWSLVVMVVAALACNAPANSMDTIETRNAANILTATAVQSMSTAAPQTSTQAVPTAILPTPIGVGAPIVTGTDPVFIGPIQFTDNTDAVIGAKAFGEGI